jgi:carbonic anhydrase
VTQDARDCRLLRRRLLAVLPAMAVLPALRAAAEAPACAVFTHERQHQVAPRDALRMLAEGNARFVDGHTVNCDLMAQVRETAAGQAPFAAVVGCIDSRVPPELVFDQRIGDIFCARVAGNFVNTDIIGSLEFATELEGARAIVVLGHSECGAIKGAVDGAKLGNLTATLRNFDAALAEAKVVPKAGNSKDKALVQRVVEANVRVTLHRLAARSDILKKRVARGELAIAGALHDIATGRVTFLA